MNLVSRIAVAALFSLCVFAAPALAQKVPYEKYTLPNGLTVILHEDHALPRVTINLWYYVGAKEEPARRSGFAHLFEHLMFMGTQRVPGSGFDDRMEAGGGANNASTSLDRTNYFSWGPSELLPTLLYLDADRMEDFGRFMTQEKLDLQRDVVRNEIRQNVENTPYGRADDSPERVMFPPSHPYYKGVYGTHEDLEAATVNDVRDFFANFYVPNNCSLVVAGDFDPAKIKPLINDLFGTIPAGTKPNRRSPAEYPMPTLGKVVRQTMFDQVEQPRVSFMYHSPAQFADGDAEMDLISSMLAGGKSSRLYKRLVLEDKLAVDVVAFQASATLSSLFHIQVYAIPGVDLAKIENAVDEEIEKLRTSGPTSDELAQYQSQTELAFLSRLNSLAMKADAMNQYQYAFNEPDSFKRDLDRYRNATVTGVRSWAKQILTPDSRGIVQVLPLSAEGREPSARDAAPSNEQTPKFELAKPEEFTLSSGVPVKLWTRTDLPMASMLLTFHAGGRKAGGAILPLDKAGASTLLAKMLEEGTGDMDGVAFAQAIESAGASFGAGSEQESFTVSLTGIRRNLEKSLDLASRAIRSPRFNSDDFARVKGLHLEELAQQDANPQAVSARVASRAFYGDNNPYAVSASGSPDSVAKLSLDDLKSLHAALFVPGNATIYVAGDLSRADAEAMLDKAFGSAGWASSGTPALKPTPIPDTPSPASPRIVVVHRPEAVQTVIRYIMPGPRAADPARVTLEALNTILGGSFTSRLNRNLREENGFTYGARSAYRMEATTGTFSASSSVKAEVTGEALIEFYKEFDRLRSGDISDEETGKGTRSLRSDTIESLASLSSVVSQAASLDSVGLSFTGLTADLDQMGKITTADLNAAAKAAVPLDQSILVLVGDRATIAAGLDKVAKAGRNLPKVEELDNWGMPVK